MEDAAKRPRGRPRTGVTPKRNIRVGPIWDEVAEIAATRGETMTDVVTRLLENYARRHVAGTRRRMADSPSGGDHPAPAATLPA